VADCIETIGFGFMFAPQHHAAMKHVVPVRKALGVRTIFNLLGPLTNPADAPHQVIGVSDGPFLEHMAMALARLGGRSALVVSSEDGLDEISIAAPTRVVELRDGKVETYTVTPEDLGVERTPIDTIAFGAPEENARVTRAVLSGSDTGAARSLTLVNAGAAVYAAGRADSLQDGVAAAATAVDSGAAGDILERFVSRTQELAAS
jgi:anthranilate phosphoribosyltransferase